MLQTSLMIKNPETWGGLPLVAINAILQIVIPTDLVYVSIAAKEHIALGHTYDYPLCLELLPSVILTPEFAGYTNRHPENFTILKRHHNRVFLAAIHKTPNEFGKLPLQSCYFIDEDSLQQRIRIGYVHEITRGTPKDASQST